VTKYLIRPALGIVVVVNMLGCVPRIQEEQLIFVKSAGPTNCNLAADLPIKATNKFLLTLTKIEIPKEFKSIKWNVYGPLSCGAEITFFARQKLVIVDGRIPTAFGSDFVAIMQADGSFKVKFGL
jgi:hypothetical protein